HRDLHSLPTRRSSDLVCVCVCVCVCISTCSVCVCVCVCVCVIAVRSSVCVRSEEHTSELQSHLNLVCRLLLEKKNARGGTHARAPTLRHCHATAARAPTAPDDLSLCTTPRPSLLLTHTHPISFFFNDTATTEIYTLSLHDALPI